MLKIRLSFTGRCPRHPRYSPEKHGQGAIKAGCEWCQRLWSIYVDSLTLDRRLHAFKDVERTFAEEKARKKAGQP